MSGPQKASEVPLDPAALGKTDDQIAQERTRHAVKARLARGEALRRTGALDGSGSPDLATKLEARVNGIAAKGAASFKAKRAVAEIARRRTS